MEFSSVEEAKNWMEAQQVASQLKISCYPRLGKYSEESLRKVNIRIVASTVNRKSKHDFAILQCLFVKKKKSFNGVE